MSLFQLAYFTDLYSGLEWPAPSVDFISWMRKLPSASDRAGERTAETAFFMPVKARSARCGIVRARAILAPGTVGDRTGGRHPSRPDDTLAEIRRRPPQRQPGQIAQHLGMRITRRHRQPHPAGGHPKAHSDLDQLQPQRATLRPRQTTQRLEQLISERREVQAQLIGRHLVRSANRSNCCSLMRFSMSPRVQYFSSYSS